MWYNWLYDHRAVLSLAIIVLLFMSSMAQDTHLPSGGDPSGGY